MTARTTMTATGQVTIPESVRERAGLEPGMSSRCLREGDD
ncbi:MAG: AbrB/MazE/SpoVT family DNA-binding domain-containing protein [Actinomycetaceae bacterium]|nr:AbrB/MazE/SpoVT family DNA-binding domain-containing protein [Actinomycetaceae bacterium]